MLASLIIVFRELIEAGLVVGIIMAATRGVPYRGRWVSYGIAAGVLGACSVAIFADIIGNAMEGIGQEIFNALVLLIAVLMLTWHNVWMASHGRAIATEMKAVGNAVAMGQRSLAVLAIVVGVAVLREGAEVVLFLYGIAVSGSEPPGAMISGSILWLVLGGAMAVLMYLGLLRIPSRYIFGVTSWLIALLAAGMAAQAVAFLQQAGEINVLTQTVWDTSHILPDKSITGKILHTLTGYMDRPNQMQLIVYAATLTLIFSLMRIFKTKVQVQVFSAS